MKKSFSVDLTNIEQAKNYQGWLKKEGHNLSKWQKRYFSILSDDKGGFVLAYFQSQDDSKPKSYIKIDQILAIEKKEEREFKVKSSTKNMHLKAKSQQIRDEWCKYLKVLQDFMDSKTINFQQQILDSTTGNGSNKTSSDSQDNNLQELKMTAPKRSYSLETVSKSQMFGSHSDIKDKKSKQSLDKDLMNVLCLNKEKKDNELSNSQINSDLNNSDLNKSQVTKNKNNQIPSEQNLKNLGLVEYLLPKFNQNKDAINNRIYHGFLDKRSTQNLKFFNRRWFLLISAKSLFPDTFNDEILLQNKDLPLKLELDTLYYYEINKNGEIIKTDGEFQYKKGFLLNDCIDITEKDITQSKEKGFTFSLNILSRFLHLMADKETVRAQWKQIITISMNTAKELKKGNGELKKNIDYILQIYDSQQSLIKKKSCLQQKIEEDIKIYKVKYEKEKSSMTVLAFIRIIEELLQYMIDVMEACLVKNPQRSDIIKEYSDYLHQYITGIIKQFWDKKYKHFTLFEIIQFAQMMENYDKKLQQFLKDDRISQATQVLLEIYYQKQIEIADKNIDNLIEAEKQNNVPVSMLSSSVVQTETPKEILKIIQDLIQYQLDHMSKSNQSAVIAARLCSHILDYYQEQFNDFIEDIEEVDQEQLLYLTNNAIALEELVLTIYQSLIAKFEIQNGILEKSYKQSDLQKGFKRLANETSELFQISILSDTQRYFFKKEFLDIELDSILEQLISTHRKSIIMLNQKHQEQVWQCLLDQLILFYVQTLVISSSKSNQTNDAQDFIYKIKEDSDYLKSQFGNFLKKENIVKSLISLQEIIDFLTIDNQFSMQQNCKKLRKAFGKPFTVKTVKYLLNLRHDFNKQEKAEITQSCDEIIKQYNKEFQDEEDEIYDEDGNQKSNQMNNNKIGTLGEEEEEEDDEDLNYSRMTDMSQRSFKRNATLKLDDDNFTQKTDINASYVPDADLTFTRQKTIVGEEGIEGYLLKKKHGAKLFEKRYFRLTGEYILWYKNKKSQDCINKFQISQIEDVYYEDEKKLTFYIKLKQDTVKKGKEYKMKAEEIEERDEWINMIRKKLDKIRKQEMQKYEAIEIDEAQELIIITDYDKQNRIAKLRQKSIEKKKKIDQKEKQRMESINKNRQSYQNMNSLRISTASKRASQITNQVNFNIENNSKNDNTQPFINPKQEYTCWDKFLQCLGVQKKPKKYYT